MKVLLSLLLLLVPAADLAIAGPSVGLDVNQLICKADVSDTVQRLVEERRSEMPSRYRMSPMAVSLIIRSIMRQFKTLPPERAMQQQIEKVSKSLGLTDAEFQETAELVFGRRSAPQVPEFLTAPHVRVVIENEVPHYCDKACEGIIEQNVALALVTWRLVCLPCEGHFLTSISSSSRTWVDRGVMKWLEGENPSERTFPNMENATAVAYVNAMKGNTTPTNDHVALAPQSRAREALCKLPRPAAAAPLALGSLWDAVCSGGASVRTDSQVRVILKRDLTNCIVEPGFEAVGCGRLKNTVELPFKGMAFEFPVPGSGQLLRVGPPHAMPISGKAVLLHEVGHWFGLQHADFLPDRIPDIMRGDYAADGCMTMLSSNMLGNVSSLEYAARFQHGSALRRPIPPPHSDASMGGRKQ